jgi:hypothetical protein
VAIVRLSLIVSLSAVFFAALIGVPLGALIALTRFRGRDGVIVVLNASIWKKRTAFELEPGYTISGMCAAFDIHSSIAAPLWEALSAAGLPA